MRVMAATDGPAPGERRIHEPPNDQADVVTLITVTRGADAWKRLAAKRVSRAHSSLCGFSKSYPMRYIGC